MAKRRRQEREGPTRKQQAMTRREQEQARRIRLWTGAALGLAVAILVGGLIFQFLLLPGSAVAEVGQQKISAKDLQARTRFQQYQDVNQLVGLLNFQQQYDPTGEQGFFTSQIQQLQGVLSNPEGLANQTLEQMIDEAVIRQGAQEAGVVVSEEEIQAELESLIASQLGAVTVPQATATAEALAVATATPSPTPSPTPTTTVTTTDTVPTLEPQPTPTVQVLTAEDFTTNYQQLIENVATGAEVGEAQAEQAYRDLITTDLLRTKLTDALGDQMPTSGERVRARHILIAVAEDAPDVEQQAALAKAISITQQLNAGADFAELAQQFSDDTGSGAQGGDLGFFGRGQMVPEFEDAAFSLEIGQISEPVRSQFGYHIIQVEERDQGLPDFNAWLQDRKTAVEINRQLTNSRLPSLPAVNPQLLVSQAPAAAPVLPAPQPPAPVEATAAP